MRLKNMLAWVLELTLGLSAATQTKISGTNQSAKPDPQTMVEEGDRLTCSLSQTRNSSRPS